MGSGQKAGLDWQALQQGYTVVRSEEKKVALLTHKQTKQEFMVREIASPNRAEMQALHESAQQKQHQRNKNVLQLVRVEFLESEEYCTTVYRLHLMFEYPSKTLLDLMNERACQRRRFPDADLRTIVFNVILGMAYLQSQNVRHQTLRSAVLFHDQQ
jgi:hypothetical protein